MIEKLWEHLPRRHTTLIYRVRITLFDGGLLEMRERIVE